MLPVRTNILVQTEIIELIEGLLLVFPAHVCSSSLRNSQPLVGVSFSHRPAGRGSGPPPPVERPQEVAARSAASELCGPTLLRAAVAPLVAMALGLADREA